MVVKVLWKVASWRLLLSAVSALGYHDMRMVIEEIKRGGDDLLFSSQNLQDSSDCAKNRAPDSSWVEVSDKILFYTKIILELGDRACQS